MALQLQKPIFLIPFVCFILELIALVLAATQHNSVCIQAGEITKQANIFIMFIFSCLLPDLLLSSLAVLTENISLRPFAVLYNGLAAAFCIVGGVVLLSGLTFCGNIAQIFFLMCAILGLVAGCGHGFAVVTIRKNLPAGVKFARGE